MSQSFSAKDPAEVIVLSMDFSQLLVAGETVSACSFTAADVQRKADATASMIMGQSDITAAPVVKQKVQGGVLGHSYVIKARITLSPSGRVLVGAATLPVRDGAQ